MKKLCLLAVFILALILVSTIAFADTEEPVNTTIDTTTWTAIALDGATACTSYLFQSRDGSDFYWKKTATSTNYFTVKDGAALIITFNRARQPTTLFFAQAATGTPVIEVFVFNNN
jgi:hypothetical protein